MEDVSSPAALVEKISDQSGLVEKSRADAMHATVKHLLDFYREEFPGLEGSLSAVLLRCARRGTDLFMSYRLASTMAGGRFPASWSDICRWRWRRGD